MTTLASFEDIIYVIIGILWIAFSFYNAKKKKDAKKASDPTIKHKSVLDSILGEIGYNNEPADSALYKKETNQAEVEPATLQMEESSEVFSYDDDYEESNFKSPIDVIEKESFTPNINKAKDHSKNIKKNPNKRIKKKIDLRKAIIYSEIIKKVYF